MKKNANELFQCLITLDGLVSQDMNISKPLSLQVQDVNKRFKTEKLIETINNISPQTGRIKALAIMYYFSKRIINIPSISSAKRLIRNENILARYKEGKSYTELSHEFNITERWIRTIIKIMIKRSVSW